MTQSFNLIDREWIPCETLEGGFIELGLRDTLAHAHELRGICADSPLETAALYRLLLAVLHRVFGPASTEAWFELWQRRQWDNTRLDAYWDTWHDRFDLLHSDENRRFYQRRPLEGKTTPVIHLVHSSGNNPTLFSHITDTNYRGLTPAQAARAVVTAQAFRVGGLLKPGLSGPDSPAARGISFMLEGQTLFETTMLNLWPYPDWNMSQVTGIPQTAHDVPAWEQDDPIGTGRRLPLGCLDYLSWQSYRIWLEEPGTDGLLRELQIGLGQPKLAPTVFDPSKHHRAVKKSSQNPSGYTPLRFSESRVLWRDSSAILEPAQGGQADADKRPYCITWLNTLFAEDAGDRLQGYERTPLLALGMASDQAKIEFYREERMPVPAIYLHDRRLVSLLKAGLERSEQARQALSRALFRLAEYIIAPDTGKTESRKPRREDIRPLVDHWNVERQYWASLGSAFWRLVENLPQSGEAALVAWVETLMRAAREAFESAENLAGNDARVLKAAAEGRRTLEWHLAPMRKEIEQWQKG